MTTTLDHRGPDDSGTEFYQDDIAAIGFGHTRLSIIDLSTSGHQPMTYKNLSIIFNGEIYNYQEIKKELAERNHQFKSTSDTEVILHAFKEWGPECVEKFIGMFVFVIYDAEQKKVTIFRDRAGVKPLYYYLERELFLFGSEMKALMKHPSFMKKIDRRALKSYFDFGYIPAPFCIFENTHKLEPGSYLVYDLNEKSINTIPFWNAIDYYQQPKLKIEYQEAKEELHALLKSAFKYRMIADVPVGVFLSGGYDSTAVAAVLQSSIGTKLKTFTIGFEEGNNEAPFAKNTAEYLGTDHHEYTCTTKEAQEIIPFLPYHFDEPFADSSAIPTMLVSRFAREHVPVALSADARDELFVGYNSYSDLQQKLKWMNSIPDMLKPSSAALVRGISSLVPRSQPALKHKLDGLSKSLNRDKFQQVADLFRLTNSLPQTYSNCLFNGNSGGYKTKFDINTMGFQNPSEIVLAVDYQSYLQNDILTKVDRATMSVSLEGRDPLVDHRLLEFAARLPFKYKYDGISTKRILKDIVHDYIPRELMDRPKTGFSLPIYSWLRGDLSYLIDDYLNERKLGVTGLFNIPFLLEQIELFKLNKLHYSPFIWKLLMFQMWYKKWMG
jgi:asparagine synthase (glutamine-hydrolysing)